MQKAPFTFSFGPGLARLVSFLSLGVLALALGAGCKKKTEPSTEGGSANGAHKQTIQNIGSDTMVNLAQAWAEEYAKIDPAI